MARRGTLAIIAAERAGVAHQVHEYAHDPTASSYGLEAAEKLGVEPERVFKTIFVSAGRRGLELELAPTNLVALTFGELGTIATGGRA